MRLVLLLFTAFTLSGCFPYRYTHRPGVGGTVTSARAHRPIPGVTVALDGPGGHVSTSTAADGHFAIAPLFQWGIYVVPMDIWASPCPLSVTHPGFHSYSQDISVHPMSGSAAAIKDVGVITLEPLR